VGVASSLVLLVGISILTLFYMVYVDIPIEIMAMGAALVWVDRFVMLSRV
jgi:hypothetical protein